MKIKTMLIEGQGWVMTDGAELLLSWRESSKSRHERQRGQFRNLRTVPEVKARVEASQTAAKMMSKPRSYGVSSFIYPTRYCIVPVVRRDRNRDRLFNTPEFIPTFMRPDLEDVMSLFENRMACKAKPDQVVMSELVRTGSVDSPRPELSVWRQRPIEARCVSVRPVDDQRHYRPRPRIAKVVKPSVWKFVPVRPPVAGGVHA